MASDGEVPHQAGLAALRLRLDHEPVENPLVALQQLAGRLTSWLNYCEECVRLLEGRIRYSTDGGEAIRGEITLYTQAMRDLSVTLVAIGRLNIDERLVAIAEAQKDMILTAIDAGLLAAGIRHNDPRMADARLAVVRHLRVISGGQEPRRRQELTAG